MSSLPLVLKNLLAFEPLAPWQQDLVLDMLPTMASSDAVGVLRSLKDNTPSEEWTVRTRRTLCASDISELRGEGWYAAGQAPDSFTLEEWEAAALVETNRHVRRELITIAPRRASPDAVLALVDATTLEIDIKATDAEGALDERLNEYTWFAFDLLEHLPPHLAWVSSELLQHTDPTLADITKSNAALRNCDATSGALDPRVPALYRIRLAAHPSVPAGVMTELLNELRQDRTALDAVSNTITAGTHLRSAFHAMLDAAYGTGADRVALREFLADSDIAGATPSPEELDRHNIMRQLEKTAPPAHLVCATLMKPAAMLRRHERAQGLWDRLFVQDRTDSVCVAILKESVEMGPVILEHLGDRAHDVLTSAGMLSVNATRQAGAPWLLEVDPDLWVTEVRGVSSDSLMDTILGFGPAGPADLEALNASGVLHRDVLKAQKAVARDLTENPTRWPTANGARALKRLLPAAAADVLAAAPTHLVAVWAAKKVPNAADALWTSLAGAVQANPDGEVGRGASVVVDPARATAVAAMLTSADVQLSTLQMAQHV